MDAGIFKASRARLIAWIVVPPVLIVAAGMGSHAWQQRAEWRLRQALALTDVLPGFVRARAEANRLVDELGLSSDKIIKSEEQLISLVQDTALETGFTIDAVHVQREEVSKENDIPQLRATVEGSGDFRQVQHFAAHIQDGRWMVSIPVIELMQPRMQGFQDGFKARLIFNLQLIEEVLEVAGGEQ